MLPHLNLQSLKLVFITSQDLPGSWLNEVNTMFSALCIILHNAEVSVRNFMDSGDNIA